MGKQETYEEFLERIHAAQVSFDQLAEWYYKTTAEIAILNHLISKLKRQLSDQSWALEGAREELHKNKTYDGWR